MVLINLVNRQPSPSPGQYVSMLLFALILLTSPLTLSQELRQSSLALKNDDCRFVGSFVQSKFLSGLADPAVSQGTFLHDCQVGVIWASHTPIDDVLVLRAANQVGTQASKKASAYRIIEKQVEKLKSQQGKLVAELVMSLMSGDPSLLQQRFKVSSSSDDRQVLIPKKRALRRAIQRIEISQTASSDSALTIEITDRNHQLTRIHVTKDKTIEAMDEENCRQQMFGENACQLLFKEDT